MSARTYRIDPIKHKVKVLGQLGINNKEKLKSYLNKRTSGITDDVKLDQRLDIICRKIILDFYDGDKTFVKESEV